ncbi:MAG TPA: hypothetical protein VNE71_11105, partial [Myxococcota bacterium]|nr:hypothetical protein [Myxococcota bacterium]
MMGPLRELGLRTPWDVWRAARNFAITVWDPTRSDIQHGINTLVFRAIQEAPPERETELARAHPDLLALYRERYDPDLTPDRLERLPDGTLGREYARFIRANGITPLKTLLALGEPKTLVAYQFRRARALLLRLAERVGDDRHLAEDARVRVQHDVHEVVELVRAPALALAVLFMNIGLRRPREMREAVRRAAH